jgi:hypothetical protein
MTPHNHSIGVCVNEIIVKQESPDCMHEIPMTMGQYSLLLSIPFGMDLFKLILE